MRQVAGLVVIAKHELAVFGQPVGIWILMNAINRGDEAILQFARNGFIRGQHKLLDELVRFVVLDPLEADRFALLIEAHLHFRKIEIERTVLKTLSAEKRS